MAEYTDDEIETYECEKCEIRFEEDEYNMEFGLCQECFENEYGYPKLTKEYVKYTQEHDLYPCANCDKILEEEFEFRRQYEGMPYHTEMDTHLCEYCCQQYDKAEEEEEEDEVDFINTQVNLMMWTFCVWKLKKSDAQ